MSVVIPTAPELMHTGGDRSYNGFVCFELNSIRFIDLDPGPKQMICEPDPVHEI